MDDLLGSLVPTTPSATPAAGPPPDLGTLTVALGEIQPGPHPSANVYDKHGLKVRCGS